jgi:hypothetical protein
MAAGLEIRPADRLVLQPPAVGDEILPDLVPI